MDAASRDTSAKRSGWALGLCFGLGLRPLTWLLAHVFSGPIAFGLAVFIVSVLSYPLFPHAPRWSWMRNWGFWHFAVYSLAISVVAFFLSFMFFPNP